MESYEVTQAVLSVGTVYHVRKPRTEPTLYTIRGELVTTAPKFHLVEGEAGKAVADLTANFIKTRYDVRSGEELLAAIVFPAVAFKKTLALTAGGVEYTADGGVFKGVFQGKRADGHVAFEIAKELSFIRDTFLLKTDGSLPLAVGLLAVVAIHSRFYDYV
jgi:uncharacterized protein YxjI